MATKRENQNPGDTIPPCDPEIAMRGIGNLLGVPVTSVGAFEKKIDALTERVEKLEQRIKDLNERLTQQGILGFNEGPFV